MCLSAWSHAVGVACHGFSMPIWNMQHFKRTRGTSPSRATSGVKLKDKRPPLRFLPPPRPLGTAAPHLTRTQSRIAPPTCMPLSLIPTTEVEIREHGAGRWHRVHSRTTLAVSRRISAPWTLQRCHQQRTREYPSPAIGMSRRRPSRLNDFERNTRNSRDFKSNTEKCRG